MRPYICESEELESLREQVISLNRERAELIEALRCVMRRHESPIGARLKAMDAAHISALLSRLGAA